MISVSENITAHSAEFYRRKVTRLVVMRRMYRPEAPRGVPFKVLIQRLWNIVHAAGTAWPTPHNAEKAYPAAIPKSVAGNGFIGIFGACWKMAAIVADKTGQRKLIKANEANAQ